MHLSNSRFLSESKAVLATGSYLLVCCSRVPQLVADPCEQYGMAEKEFPLLDCTKTPHSVNILSSHDTPHSIHYPTAKTSSPPSPDDAINREESLTTPYCFTGMSQLFKLPCHRFHWAGSFLSSKKVAKKPGVSSVLKTVFQVSLRAWLCVVQKHVWQLLCVGDEYILFQVGWYGWTGDLAERPDQCQPL